MQIIIVEAEIKQAIKDLILNQMSIKEGMDIDIDLSATRGADGFKATIDIVPAKLATTKAEAPKAETAKPAVVAPAKKEEPAPKAEVVSQGKEQEPPFEPDTSKASTDGADASNGPATTASAEPSSSEPETTPEQPAEEVKPAGRSLFQGLKRVNNG